MRAIVNRVLSFATFGALAVFAAFVAIEAGGLLAGRSEPIGPIDYRSAWNSMDDWNPSDALRALIYAGVMVLGLAIVVFELSRRKDGHDATISEGPHGVVTLEARPLRRYVKARIEERDWIGRSDPRLELSGSRAVVRDRPKTTRPHDQADVLRLKEQLEQDLRRIGLEPDRVEIDPRTPSGRRQRRVR